jgi:GNAT superfamily N-acetyltransferase
MCAELPQNEACQVQIRAEILANSFRPMEIRRAKPEDAVALTEIAFAAKRYWGYPEVWIQAWKEVLTIQPDFIARNETYVACLDGETMGFYALVHGNDRASLEHLWVIPSAMGQGIGRALFHHAVQRTKALGIEAIEIESDPNAEKFYEQMGARRISLNVTEIEGQSRSLPVLRYDCT